MKLYLIPTTVLMILIFFFNAGATAAGKNESTLRTIQLGGSYIPNVQFAPYYVAQKKGFYEEEGLVVKIEYGYENDFVTLTAQGARDFALASGDQIILARSQGLPITYILKWYQRYPVAVMSMVSKKIIKLSDLKGKRVGIPGFFGASYIGWKALLYASGIDEKDITVKQIGFTQASAVQQNLVDAAVVYIVNEPVLLRTAGIEVDVIEVSDFIDLVSNGLAVGDGLIKKNPGLVRRMVRATQKGIAYAINYPAETFAICREAIPEITDKTAAIQRQVLDASIKLWRSEQPGISSLKSWRESVDFMKKTGLLTKSVDINKLYTNDFVSN